MRVFVAALVPQPAGCGGAVSRPRPPPNDENSSHGALPGVPRSRGDTEGGKGQCGGAVVSPQPCPQAGTRALDAAVQHGAGVCTGAAVGWEVCAWDLHRLESFLFSGLQKLYVSKIMRQLSTVLFSFEGEYKNLPSVFSESWNLLSLIFFLNLQRMA